VEIEENQKTVSLASHRPWKSLRDSHISTASATSPLLPKSNRNHRIVERSSHLVPVIPASPLGSSFNWNVLSVLVRSSKHFNKLIEQDHLRIQQPLRPMLVSRAGIVISGIELAEPIRKGQFKFGKLGWPAATMPKIWRVALAA